MRSWFLRLLEILVVGKGLVLLRVSIVTVAVHRSSSKVGSREMEYMRSKYRIKLSMNR